MSRECLRIVHVLNHCIPGNGHVNVAVDLACQQSAMGHQVYMVSRGGDYIGILENCGVRHISIRGFCSKWTFGIRAFAILVIREKPDILHSHMMASALISFLIGRLLRIKLVTTMHNSFDKHSGLMRLSDLVVAVSLAEHKNLALRGFRRHKLRMIHNGPIGTSRAAMPSDEYNLSSEKIIMTLSGLHSRKRVNDAICAFSLVHDDFEDWRLVVAGEGPDEPRLRKLCKKLGVEKKVFFVGIVANPTLLLKKASIFLALSEAEPFGLVVVEAKAAKCAVIVTDTGGMPELVNFGKSGIVVSIGNPTEVAGHLRRLMGNEQELNFWQSLADKDLDNYTVDTMASRYLDAYHELLN